MTGEAEKKWGLPLSSNTEQKWGEPPVKMGFDWADFADKTATDAGEEDTGWWGATPQPVFINEERERVKVKPVAPAVVEVDPVLSLKSEIMRAIGFLKGRW